MSELTQIEREAKQVRDFIAELKGLTPRFNATKERAEEELRLHLNKIDGERAKLRQLIDAAAVIVQRLGAETVEAQAEPVATEAEITEAEVAAVMAEDLEAVEAGAEIEPIDAYAAEITAAVADLAAEVPATPDATDEPELTDEQVERVEETLAAEPARELETAGTGPRRFNPFAANPFA